PSVFLRLEELNLGRDRIKILQHEISCRSTSIKTNALKAGTDQDQGVEKRDIHLRNAHHLLQMLVRISKIEKGRHQKTNRKYGSKKSKVKGEAANIAADSINENEISRKEMGLDWMLRPESKGPTVSVIVEKLPEEDPVEEVASEQCNFRSDSYSNWKPRKASDT
ncbi:hypothetical protein S245_043805, partial [Arachis hypogaea]